MKSSVRFYSRLEDAPPVNRPASLGAVALIEQDGGVKRIVTSVFRTVPHPGQSLKVSPESKSLRWWAWDEVDEPSLVETHRDILRAVRSGASLFLD